MFGYVIYFPSKNALQKPVNFGLLRQAPALNFRRIWFFLIFFTVTSNYKNSKYPRSFLCEEAKFKQRKNFVKSVRKQYGNPDSHTFWIYYHLLILLIDFIINYY